MELSGKGDKRLMVGREKPQWDSKTLEQGSREPEGSPPLEMEFSWKRPWTIPSIEAGLV